MCGGKADDTSAPAPNPIELPVRRPTASSARPPTAKERPQTKHRPHTSGEHRPQSHRRPQSEKRTRPPSNTTRPPKTSEHGRRSSSRRDHHTRDGHRQRRDIAPIPEYTEDRTILKRVADISNLIEGHAVNFYPLNISSYSGIPEMDDPRTRHAAIRRYIAQKVIGSIIMETDGSPDTAEVAREIADDLKVYSNSNGERLEHLGSLCKLSDKMRRDIEGHLSSWEFGSQDEEGYIVLVPALFRDGEQVIPSEKFKLD
ncbi:uncharacterized protein PAC_00274 [Phialocephala subalpina]|uniref:Uncharacterized protein n=1 Tax=Phialocephala subalpina TaxID=576137 RepID=A0A1L7WCB0_9HELO|nr:uncharacterized protein PAC_00274 [Phialocephala subalpina]